MKYSPYDWRISNPDWCDKCLNVFKKALRFSLWKYFENRPLKDIRVAKRKSKFLKNSSIELVYGKYNFEAMKLDWTECISNYCICSSLLYRREPFVFDCSTAEKRPKNTKNDNR